MKCDRCHRDYSEAQLRKTQWFNVFEWPVTRRYCPACVRFCKAFAVVVVIAIVVLLVVVAVIVV